MILVTGASGNVGGDLVAQLLAKGQKVRVLARDLERVAHLPRTVERVVGDLAKPETLRAAFSGVKSLFLVTTESGGTTQVDHVAGAASAAKLAQIVYLSSLSAARPTTQIGRWHHDREQCLVRTGVPWTFLRPGAFMSNARQWIRTVKGDGAIYLPHADRTVYPIDSLDMATVAAVALTTNGHLGKAYAMTGEEGLTGRAQVALLAKVLAKPLNVVGVSIEQAREGMTQSGMPAVMADAVAELLDSDWDLDEDAAARRIVRELTGRPASTFEAWARRNAKDFC